MIWIFIWAKYCPFIKLNIWVKYFPHFLLHRGTIFGQKKPFLKIDSRDIVEGVDDDEAECDEEDDSRRHHVRRDQERDPRHDDEDRRRQVHIQQVG